MELGTTDKAQCTPAGPSELGRGPRARQCAPPVPFCFAHKQVVAAVVGSLGPRQDPHLLPQPMARGWKSVGVLPGGRLDATSCNPCVCGGSVCGGYRLYLKLTISQFKRERLSQDFANRNLNLAKS